MSWFKAVKPGGARGASTSDVSPSDASAADSTLARGHRAEDRARRMLEAEGMTLLAANYRVAKGPSRHAGEVDLVMRVPDGTLVFVEVRSRRDTRHGGAAATVDPIKQQRIRRAAEHYLSRLATWPPCRFDVVAIDGERIEWLRAAFDAS